MPEFPFTVLNFDNFLIINVIVSNAFVKRSGDYAQKRGKFVTFKKQRLPSKKPPPFA